MIAVVVIRKIQDEFFSLEQDSWYIYALLFALAPLVVLTIPYFLFKQFQEYRESKRKNAERFAAEKLINDKKNAAMEAYKSTRPVLYNPDTDEIPNYPAIGRQLLAAVNEKQYFSLLDCLDKVTIDEESQLFVQGRIATGEDEKCKLLIRLPDGKITDQIFDFLSFEKSCMGAWQALLLHTLWHYLPLFGHGIYSGREAIYNIDDANSCCLRNCGSIEQMAVNSIFDFTPDVREKNGKYYVSYLYWSNYEGIVREYVEISFEGNKVSNILEFSSEVLYPYNCGIFY